MPQQSSTASCNPLCALKFLDIVPVYQMLSTLDFINSLSYFFFTAVRQGWFPVNMSRSKVQCTVDTTTLPRIQQPSAADSKLPSTSTFQHHVTSFCLPCFLSPSHHQITYYHLTDIQFVPCRAARLTRKLRQ